tara:strand:- start:351 stop:1358 length:1008 start_codon:yes stop_codon:yes gene_type:complete
MNHEKTIITDLDDTLSFTHNRDWENAKPNIDLINKLNFFFKIGYKIIIVTARGQISCDGDSIKADKKYRTQIERWLKKNNVLYHELSFQKKLAIYYIDDKSIRPDEFIQIEHEELKGMSGAYICRQNNYVYKTHNNSKFVVQWYENAKKYVLIPKIYRIIGNTITMEYIKSTESVCLSKLINELLKFKKVKTNKNDFASYIDRIDKHLIENNLERKYLDLLKKYTNYYNENKSFCHGDAGIDNFISNKQNIYFIDPIYEKDLYSSWLLDISKLLKSLKRFNRLNDYKFVLSKFNTIVILILELTWWIRFYKYTNDKKNCLIEIEKLYNAITNRHT